jgi:hypothetical protein
MHDREHQQALRIDKNVPLLALDLLACIVTARIDAGPPFSALLALWLSMMAVASLMVRSSARPGRSSKGAWGLVKPMIDIVLSGDLGRATPANVTQRANIAKDQPRKHSTYPSRNPAQTTGSSLCAQAGWARH